MSSMPPVSICDPDWGCDHFELSDLSQGVIYVCRVTVSDIGKLAAELARTIVDTSWMSELDHGARRTYESTVLRTAEILKDIFEAMNPSLSIAGEFGEMMVSMGSARALNMVFQHNRVPLAELWKPQVKQNGGFDFHTVCKGDLINFGEAKFSSVGSPHGVAIAQIADFLGYQKHLRDRSDLINLVSANSITNLDKDEFGVVAAFSLNATQKEVVLANAVKSAVALAVKFKLRQVFVVGVSHGA